MGDRKTGRAHGEAEADPGDRSAGALCLQRSCKENSGPCRCSFLRFGARTSQKESVGAEGTHKGRVQQGALC